jgi:hypothetical protein
VSYQVDRREARALQQAARIVRGIQQSVEHVGNRWVAHSEIIEPLLPSGRLQIEQPIEMIADPKPRRWIEQRGPQ